MIDRVEIIDRERDFHNARFAEAIDPRAGLDKWYEAIRHGAQQQDQLVLTLSNQADVLEYGCAGGGLSLDYLNLPARARSVTGIDISDVAIGKAEGFAAERGLNNARFFAMDAEQMEFADNSFDLVFGRGIIHHLDLDRCYGEIARVLRPGGSAVFYEPLGHNPVLNAYRNSTPDIRTPDEHPLLMLDFELARRYFGDVEVTYFGMMSLVSALAPRPIRTPLYRIGVLADELLLRIPFISRYAWYALMVLRKRAPAH